MLLLRHPYNKRYMLSSCTSQWSLSLFRVGDTTILKMFSILNFNRRHYSINVVCRTMPAQNVIKDLFKSIFKTGERGSVVNEMPHCRCSRRKEMNSSRRLIDEHCRNESCSNLLDLLHTTFTLGTILLYLADAETI